MIIRFWGVRGSIPVPSPATSRFGGNTSCVSVEQGNELLILDAGTGIRALGASPVVIGKDVSILLTHLHGDHVQGFPFFEPLYRPGRTIHLLDYERDGCTWSLLNLLDGVHFPLRLDDLPATCVRVQGDVLGHLARRGMQVERLPVNHPGDAYGYRVQQDERAFVYIPDNELRPPGTGVTSFERFVAFCSGADVVAHDAQYLERELPAKEGWGHSTVAQVCDLAVAAGIGHLVLFHHDPSRTDAVMLELEADARARLRPHGIACTAAYEGLRFDLAYREAAANAPS